MGPPEGHASPHPDRRLHAAVPPVFHVALLAHHTADQRSGHVPVGGTTRIERSSKFRFPGWLVSLALATMNSHTVCILQVQSSGCWPCVRTCPETCPESLYAHVSTLGSCRLRRDY